VPAFRVADAVDTTDPRFRRYLKAGITSVFVGPGLRSVIGGCGAVVKTTGGLPESVEVSDAAGLRVELGPEASSGNRATRGMESSNLFVRRPTTRMGTVWLIRHAFIRFQNGGSALVKEMPADELLVYRAVAKGKLPIRFHARRATDIHTALRLAAEFDAMNMNWNVVIDEAVEGYKAADALAAARARVVLGPFYASPRTSGERREGYAARADNAATLHRAGVPIAFRSGDQDDPDAFRTDVGRLVAAGLPHAAAIRAFTLEAARTLGVADRIGSLEEGKHADLVVFSGDPLSPTTRVLGVMVNGRWEHVDLDGLKQNKTK
jgi:imidazolonepropionase-like amidohydrolase